MTMAFKKYAFITIASLMLIPIATLTSFFISFIDSGDNTPKIVSTPSLKVEAPVITQDTPPVLSLPAEAPLEKENKLATVPEPAVAHKPIFSVPAKSPEPLNGNSDFLETIQPEVETGDIVVVLEPDYFPPPEPISEIVYSHSLEYLSAQQAAHPGTELDQWVQQIEKFSEQNKVDYNIIDSYYSEDINANMDVSFPPNG